MVNPTKRFTSIPTACRVQAGAMLEVQLIFNGLPQS